MFEEIEPARAEEARRFEARLTRVDRWPLTVVVLVPLFLVVAILKPWAGADAPSVGRADASGGDRVAGEAAASERSPGRNTPAPPRTGAAVIEMCLDPGSWRTATIETWRDKTVRVWRAIEPTPASRPLDPGIPVVPAVGSSIAAIGFCAPTSGPDQPSGPATTQAWRVKGGEVRALALRQIVPAVGISPYGALYGPPAELGATTSWPDGRVVFRYGALDTGLSLWFAIEVSGTLGEVAAPPSPSQSRSP